MIRVISILLNILALSVGNLAVAQETAAPAAPAEETVTPEVEVVEFESEDMPVEEAMEEDDGLISINFKDVDIKQVIAVLGDITGKVIIPHDNLSGTITVISLERVSPEVVAGVLESALMLKGYTMIQSGEALKVIPIAETKQMNVAVRVGAKPKEIPQSDSMITQVMPLKYSSALKLKTSLQPLIGKHGNIIANERTNTLIITDLSSNIKRLAEIIDEMEHPQPAELQVKTYMLNYGNAETISTILNDLSRGDIEVPYPSAQSLSPGAEGDPYQIYGEIQSFFDEDTSSIVVASAPVNFPAIERIIKELDVFPPQAMIEVIIMDVTLDDDFNAGVEIGDETTSTLTTEGYKTDLGSSDFRESTFHSLLGLATAASTSGFTYRILNESQTVSALGFILKTQENSKVISTPKILASNNKESSITVGQEIPIIQSSTTDLTNNVTNTDFEYEDIGLILKVTPRISRDDYVNLTVHAELTDLSAQTILNASVINKREADATVMVPDKHTVILGGLMRDNNSDIENKVPLFGDLPVVGWLFKKKTTALLKTELLIFISPYIVKSTEDIRKLTNDPQMKLKSIQDAQNIKDLRKSVQDVVGYKGKTDRLKKKKKKKSEAEMASTKDVDPEEVIENVINASEETK